MSPLGASLPQVPNPGVPSLHLLEPPSPRISASWEPHLPGAAPQYPLAPRNLAHPPSPCRLRTFTSQESHQFSTSAPLRAPVPSLCPQSLCSSKYPLIRKPCPSRVPIPQNPAPGSSLPPGTSFLSRTPACQESHPRGTLPPGTPTGHPFSLVPLITCSLTPAPSSRIPSPLLPFLEAWSQVFSMDSPLPRGVFGFVKRVQHKGNQMYCAAKFIPLRSRTCAQAYRERDILAALSHPLVTALLDQFETRKTLILILELYPALGPKGARRE